MDDQPGADFELANFLPYLLNQAAEAAGAQFQATYRSEYGMLRTEWRVLVHLGLYGDMNATEIGRRSKTHRTKISRAVAALQAKRFLVRHENLEDRRSELLTLSRAGRKAFVRLCERARRYNARLAASFAPADYDVLVRCLSELTKQLESDRR